MEDVRPTYTTPYFSFDLSVKQQQEASLMTDIRQGYPNYTTCINVIMLQIIKTRLINLISKRMFSEEWILQPIVTLSITKAMVAVPWA